MSQVFQTEEDKEVSKLFLKYMLRKFKSGAVRSSANGKIDWLGVYAPLVENSFGNYMKGHTVTETGETREYNNWQKGWEEEESIKSLARHFKDLVNIHAGLIVYKVKLEDGEDTVVFPYTYEAIYCKKLPETWHRVTKEEAYNAVRFNCGSGLLEYLKTK
jgi:hypothetical protein